MTDIRVSNVTKYYGNTCALRNVSVTFKAGKIYGLLGRNGAGKTTLLNLITNRIFSSGGEIFIDSENILENDDAIGKIFYMTEKNLYPDSMTVKKLFKWTKEFYEDFDTEYALSLCGKFSLDPKKKLKSLSTGYNTIAKIITTLASGAEILFFDEPILGLDAFHRDLFYKELLANYIEHPKTIILSTHIIEEISDLLERIVIIKDNRIAADESVEELLKSYYQVSGSAKNIDSYITGKKCVNLDQMVTFKSATIMGTATEDDIKLAKQLNLEFGKVELQKLFIYLTSAGGAVQ